MKTRIALALLLDLAYLASYFFVLDYFWLSYFLALGLAIGIMSAFRIAALQEEARMPAAAICVAPVLPFSIVNLQPGSVRVEFTRARAIREQDHGSVLRDAFDRSIWPARLALAGLFAFLLVGAMTNFIGARVVNPAFAPVDAVAERYLNRTMLLAVGSYAAARGVDRVISLASEMQVGFIGITTKPGQILKPIQDMAVRYSDFMVFVLISLGLQRILLEVAQLGAIPILGSALFLALLMATLGPAEWRARMLGVAKVSLVVLLIIRVAIPLIGLSATVVSSTLLDQRRLEAQQAIDPNLDPVVEVVHSEAEVGFGTWMRSFASQAGDMTAAARAYSDSMVERFIELMLIYLIEAVIVPVLALIGLGMVARSVLVPTRTALATEVRELRPGYAPMLEHKAS
jgi:hypothetical protein